MTYAPYPQPHTPVVKLLYRVLRAGAIIERIEFAACLKTFMSAYRTASVPECAFCDATADLIQCRDGFTRCEACAYEHDWCKQCGRDHIGWGGDDWEPESFAGLCTACRREAWSTYDDDAEIDAYYHGGRG